MSERYEMIVMGERIEPETGGEFFLDQRTASVEAEWAIAALDKRGPRALQWVRSTVGWVTVDGRAQIRIVL